MQQWHVAGNNVADSLAGAAADLNAIPETEANIIIQVYKDLALIQNRLITVIKMMPQRAHNKTILEHNKYKPTYMDRIIDKLSKSQHECVIHNQRIHCSTCNANISIRAKHIDDFIQSSCQAPEYNISYAVGNLHTHHTHRICLYGGIYLCRKCGNTSAKKLIKLQDPCERAKAHGKYNLNAYKNGTKPRGFPKWPFSSVHMMDTVIYNNMQLKVNAMHRKYAHQYEHPQSQPEEEDENMSIQAESTDNASDMSSD